MADKKKVKFVRIKGRIVPIRSKDGDKGKGGLKAKSPRKISPRKSGDTKTKKRSFFQKFTQSTGFLVGVGGGNILAGVGFGGRVGSAKLLKTGVTGAMHAFDDAQSLKFEKVVRFAQKSGKISKKFEIIGLGLQAVGVAAGGIEALLRRK